MSEGRIIHRLTKVHALNVKPRGRVPRGFTTPRFTTHLELAVPEAIARVLGLSHLEPCTAFLSLPGERNKAIYLTRWQKDAPGSENILKLVFQANNAFASPPEEGEVRAGRIRFRTALTRLLNHNEILMLGGMDLLHDVLNCEEVPSISDTGHTGPCLCLRFSDTIQAIREALDA